MGMSTIDLFAYGNKFRQEGNLGMALQVWSDLSNQDPSFAAVHINLADIHRQQGNIHMEKEELLKFLNCPQTGITIDLIPTVKNRLQELDGNHKPEPPKHQEKKQ